jgi:dienelactone hydrolase
VVTDIIHISFKKFIMRQIQSIFRILILLTVLFLFGWPLLSRQQAIGQTTCTVNPRINKIDANITPRIQTYMEYLPLDYNTNPTAHYPIIIYWGGQGEIFGTAGGTRQDLCTLLSQSLPMFINNGTFPSSVTDNTGQSYSYIVIAPMMNNTQNMNNAFEAGSVVDYVTQHYRVDPTRIYMTGISFGSYLLMEYTSSSVANARRIAAISPVANCYPSTVADFNQRANNLANGNVSIWGLSCSGDAECTPSWIQNWVNAVNAVDPGNATYTPVGCVPADSHYAWNLVYDPSFRQNGRNIYEWMILSAQSSSLPVKMKNYSARLQSDKVFVEWTTTNESNAAKFILERAGTDQEFVSVAETPATGYSSSDKQYVLIDEHPNAGLNFYRLSLVNQNGQKEFFEVKKVNNPRVTGSKINIPNPVTGSLDIYVNVDRKERIQIQVFDLNGRLLKEVKKDFFPGLSNSKIDVSAFSRGTYMIRVTGETTNTNKKVIIN